MRGVGDAAPYKVRRERSAARGLPEPPVYGCSAGEEFIPPAGRRGRRPLQAEPAGASDAESAH